MYSVFLFEANVAGNSELIYQCLFVFASLSICFLLIYWNFEFFLDAKIGGCGVIYLGKIRTDLSIPLLIGFTFFNFFFSVIENSRFLEVLFVFCLVFLYWMLGGEGVSVWSIPLREKNLLVCFCFFLFRFICWKVEFSRELIRLCVGFSFYWPVGDESRRFKYFIWR